MASNQGAVASGLDSETQATRRRNVPSTSPSGGLVNKIEVDDKKTQVKKVRRKNSAGPRLCQTMFEVVLMCPFAIA